MAVRSLNVSGRSVVVRGISEAFSTLEKMRVDLQGDGVTDDVLAGAKVIRSGVDVLTPTRTGNLRKSLVALPIRRRPNKPAAAFVKINYGKRLAGVPSAPYGHLVTGGTKTHAIRPKAKKALAFANEGFALLQDAKVFSKGVQHPGSRANPFFQRGVSSSTLRARQVILGRLKARIEQATK